MIWGRFSEPTLQKGHLLVSETPCENLAPVVQAYPRVLMIRLEKREHISYFLGGGNFGQALSVKILKTALIRAL